MEKKEKVIKIICPFILTSVILLCIFYLGGVYPFGEKILFKWDMELQYIDFFRWWNRVLHGKASMFYSFSKSLGDNAIGLTAYYLSSPFNVILYFTDNIPLFVSVVTILKMATASLTGSIFLEKVSPEMNIFWHLILSMSYGLMAYNMCQASNIMWLDGVVWLPVVSLGVWKLINEKKSLLLYLSVIVAILSNWYTAYMICLFSFFYYTYEVIKKNQFSLKGILKENFKCFIQYCITMITAVLTTMAFFLPVILNLLQGKGIESSDTWIVGFHTTMLDFLKGCFVLTVPYTGQGLTLFCGTITMLAFLGFLISKYIRKKEKIWSVIYIAFFVICAVFIPLENVWNGFRKVASYYCRFSFIISFFMIYIASVFLSEFLINKKKMIKNMVMIICLLFTCVEFSYGAYETFCEGYGRVYTTYNEYAEQEKNTLKQLKDTNKDNDFYRLEQTVSWRTRVNRDSGNYNEGMAFGFKQLSSYSSTYNNNIMEFYNKCGYSSCNRLITWREPVLPTDSILGIKYVFANIPIYGFEKKLQYHNSEKTIYENPYALGLGYKVSGKVEKDILHYTNTFDYQNQLLSKMVGYKVECYKKLKVSQKVSDNSVIWTIPKINTKSIVYGYCTHTHHGESALFIDNEYRNDFSAWYAYKTFQVSSDNTSEHIVELKGQTSDRIKGVFYYLDLSAFENIMEQLKQNQVDLKQIKDGYVEAEYDAKGTETVLMTVPYDEGWTIKVNGKPVDIQRLQNIFTGIKVHAGKNKIQMKYTVPGLKYGVIVSIIGVAGYVIFYIVCHKKKRGYA